MKITNRNLTDLVPYARNARTHSPQQIKQIEASLLEFGWCNPVSIDGKVGIVAGHGRVEAATNLMNSPDAVIPDWPDKTLVPTIDLSHLTSIQRKAYILADNKIAINAGYDSDLLALELMDLKENGFDLLVTGFDTTEIDAFFGDPVEDPAQAWDGMPEFTHEDQESTHHIIVHFATMLDFEAFKRHIRQDMSDKAKFIWYPELNRSVFADKQYSAERDDEES